MIDHYFPCDRVRRRIRNTGYGELFEEFAERLHRRGYSWNSIRGSIWAIEHFVRWLNEQNVNPNDISRDVVGSFLCDHLPVCCCPRPAPVGLLQVRPALNHLLRMLCEREEGSGRSAAPLTPIDAELQQYRNHLQKVCGVAESTCISRIRFAREFLETRFGTGPLRWKSLKPDDIISFVVGYGARCRPSTVQVAASTLRMYLRYLQFHGRCDDSLIAAVPRIANWRLSHVPRTMTAEQLRAFLDTFDRSTATGRRDYAMALCQCVLGLRVSEVTALLLDNIDWRSGVLRIDAGKAMRARELPLPRQVGQAVTDYVRHGRPPGAPGRNVFVRHRAPKGAVSTAVVREAMRAAYAKVEGCQRWGGTHVLRHTAATNLLQHGTGLKEIADVLGHRSIEATTIYAKVDLPSLSAVAMPWPEVQS